MDLEPLKELPEQPALRPAELGHHVYNRTWIGMVVRRGARNRSVQIGLLVTLFLAVLSVGAPLFTPLDPTDMNVRMILKPPSPENRFGTDDFGRDLFTRVLYGSRVSFRVGIEVAAITTVLGLLLGSLAGYYPQLDNIIMRVMDIFQAFPEILLALGIVAILGPELRNIVIALVFPFTPRTARVVRGSILALKEQEFIEAARCVGSRDLRIILTHLLPNCLAPVLVQQTYILAIAILAESGLNFLGVGLPPNVATLGGSLADARIHLRTSPWMSLYPGLFISALVLGFNLLGDGLRDVLDPRMADR
jgi:peptide/nickel transport system permease protein